MSVEMTESRSGVTYKVRRRHAGVHHARRFTTLKAAERFERKVRTSRRQANSICSTSLFQVRDDLPPLHDATGAHKCGNSP